MPCLSSRTFVLGVVGTWVPALAGAYEAIALFGDAGSVVGDVDGALGGLLDQAEGLLP